MLKSNYLEELEGDLEERFHDNLQKYGPDRARWRHVWGATKLLRPTLVKKASGDIRLNQYGMYRHYLKISFRTLLRNRFTSIINVLGLAMGLGIGLTIAQYIYFELSYDKFHSNHQNKYRVLFHKTQNGVDKGHEPYVGYAVGVDARGEIPEIKDYVRLYTSDQWRIIFIWEDGNSQEVEIIDYH